MGKLRNRFQEKRPKVNALQQKAFILEREKMSSQPPLPPHQMNVLEKMFDDVYMELQPTSQDYQAREDAVNFVEGLVRDKLSVGYIKENFGLCHVRAFGSFTMDMFTPCSDLDISLNVERGGGTFSREDKIKVLRSLTKYLRGLEAGERHVSNIQPVLKAKVPIMKFVHCKTGVECDVSTENRDGIAKSELLRIFSSIDPRFRKLCFLMKAWASAQGINNSKDGTLNSLSILLLVAFHLQTRTPAILPPFSVFLKGLQLPGTPGTLSVVQKRVLQYKDFGKKNQESVVQLFCSLLMQLVAVQDLWQQGLCASTYEGTWTLTVAKPGGIFVEDFAALSQNAARAVGETGFDAIYRCFHEALMQLKGYSTSIYDGKILKSLFFNPPVKPTSMLGKRRRDHATVRFVEDQQRFEKGLVETGHVRHYVAENSSDFSDLASWVALGERVRPAVTASNNVRKTSQFAMTASRDRKASMDRKAWGAISEGREAFRSTTENVNLLSWQDQHLANRIKLQEAMFEERPPHHLPVSYNLPVRQHELASTVRNHRNPESRFADGVVHNGVVGNNRLQDRQKYFTPAAATTDHQEAAVTAVHQQRWMHEYAGRTEHALKVHVPYSVYSGNQLGVVAPGLANDQNPLTKFSQQYDESTGVVNPHGHANALLSNTSNDHTQYNRFYNPYLHRRMYKS